MEEKSNVTLKKRPAHTRRTLSGNLILLFLGQGSHTVEAYAKRRQVEMCIRDRVMPGARACLFSLCERSFPLPLRLEPLHFEVLFCLAGMVTLTRRDGCLLYTS